MKIFILFLLLLLPVISSAQNLRWVQLTSFPNHAARKDDLCFINSFTGWVIDSQGHVCKTTDGGYTWTERNLPGGWLRCVGFADSLNGFIGVYDSSNGGAAMLKTTNGGINWYKVSNFPAPRPKGLCGICVVNSQVVYAVGRLAGPAVILKTTDRGITWIHLNPDTLASRLIDVKFFTPDSGFVCGGIGPLDSTRDVILFTSDGGITWLKKYTGTQRTSYEAIWKLSFVNRNYGAAAINQQSNFLPFLKTTDGGETWTYMLQPIGISYFTQGIGFVNPEHGWIGGGSDGSFETTDGGKNWIQNNFAVSLNRVRFYSDTLAYACGGGFYKYTADKSIGIINFSQNVRSFRLYQNYPNPFNPSTIIRYLLPGDVYIKIIIYDAAGKEIRLLQEGFQTGGPQEISWDGKDNNNDEAGSGVYFCVFQSEGFQETRKMMLVR